MQRQFLHMAASFLEVAELVQHTTPSQFEQMVHALTPHDTLKKLYELEQCIRSVRICQEQRNDRIEETISVSTSLHEESIVPLTLTEDTSIKLKKTKSVEKKPMKEGTEDKKPRAKTERKKKTEDGSVEDKKVLCPVPVVPAIPSVMNPVELVPNPGEVEDRSTVSTKKNIPKHIKTLVWNKYMGANNSNSKCFSCREAVIDCRNFHCGHVTSEAKGGDLTINNLRPICANCNLSMGTKSMNDFTLEFFGWQV